MTSKVACQHCKTRRTAICFIELFYEFHLVICLILKLQFAISKFVSLKYYLLPFYYI